MSDLIALYTGEILIIHDPAECAGENCSVHSPSAHPLNTRPLNWRGHVMERICEHGIGHPDPDDLAWRQRTGRTVHAIHGCDGCCFGTPDE